jgi:hypothetical protein
LGEFLRKLNKPITSLKPERRGKEIFEHRYYCSFLETLTYHEAQQLMKNLQTYKWNFGCLPMQASIKPRVIILTVQNTGGTDLNWNFKLPSDSQIEVEPWADPGEPTAEEAFEKTILEKKIFEIKPKSGFLQPGQLADI